MELVEKLVAHKNLEESDCLVSFYIKALHPSIPTKEVIWKLEDWLTEQCVEMNEREKAKVYTKLAALYMNLNYFVCRDQFYKTTSGTAMGNPLSPLISEIFMKSIEEEIEKRGIMPKFWARYVDDILVIIPNEDIEKTLEAINNIHHNITFTMEKEDDQRIAFLGLAIIRTNNKLEFDICRKETHTQRTIPRISKHTYGQKVAANYSMIHGLLVTPLIEERFKKEITYIKDTAVKNGYSRGK
ncbi:uncharacterized protein LOC119652028 [Hermetia illucens]|uniref:uncharacterized protein LOC119652028 n=1 Tax=Hermetia illucens TaxID=343691 RepID=UPI0018CC49E8|nr:uncharacterized protein LOC119652028 [Hermetia illucens]